MVSLTICIECDEEEARALDALVGYGDDAFIKAFYDSLGKAYMEEYEQGLRRLFKSLREILPGWLSRSNAARTAFASRKETNG